MKNEERCENCRFWDKDLRDSWNKEEGPLNDFSECLRYPPRSLAHGEPGGPHFPLAVFPETRAYEWCGEWQATRTLLPVVEQKVIPVLGDTIEKRQVFFEELLRKLIDRRIDQYKWPPQNGWLRPSQMKQAFGNVMIKYAYDFDLNGGWYNFEPPTDATKSVNEIQAIDLVMIATEILKKRTGKAAEYLKAFIELNSAQGA